MLIAQSEGLNISAPTDRAHYSKRWRLWFVALPVLLVLLVLAGCQASGLGDGLSASGGKVAPLASSTYGTGQVTVTVLLPTDPELRRKAADIADGAKLAVDDLGAGQIQHSVRARSGIVSRHVDIAK
jgi:hypothetical protein